MYSNSAHITKSIIQTHNYYMYQKYQFISMCCTCVSDLCTNVYQLSNGNGCVGGRMVLRWLSE